MIEIIMPAYNTGRALKRAIRSVTRQSFTDWKLWIVDDGTTDQETKVILDAYRILQHPKIEILRQSNGGPSSARNLAMAFIELDSIVAYCDSDDEWRLNHLDVSSRYLDGADLVYCNPKLVDPDGNQMWANFKLYDEFNHKNLKNGNFIYTPTIVHRNGIGFFDSSLDGLEDYDYWIRAYKLGYRFYQHDQETVTVTVRAAGNNNMSSKGQSMLSKIKEKHKDFFEA
jgi:glycosyltransferase involved in cell wall biosynthesis